MNANNLRSLAAEVVGRAALEERFGPPHLSALDAVLLEKSAAADPELLKVAATFDTGNMADMAAKGRAKGLSKKHLSSSERQQLRVDYEQGGVTHVVLAQRYGVSLPTVGRALRREPHKEH